LRKSQIRFKPGDKVWVRDAGRPKGDGHSGYRIVEATVREVCTHDGRAPFYPHGEGYRLDGGLWWDCYPGCRVWASRAEAIAARLTREWIMAHFYHVPRGNENEARA
jgi:hypothetical protein